MLNAAAYTAVDRAESEQELAMRVNGEAVGVLAEESRKINALLVHYSTDYVFDGSKTEPWVEEDAPQSDQCLRASKLAGERNIDAGRRAAPDLSHQLGVQSAWPEFSAHHAAAGRRNAKQLRVVNDQIGAPTTAAELAMGTRVVIDLLDAEESLEAATGPGFTT